MRILLLTSELPYPPDSGGRLKTHAIIEFLRSEHELTVACFQRHPLSQAQKGWASRLGAVHIIALNRPRNAYTLARSYVEGVPLSIERNRSAAMKALTDGLVSDAQFDAVFVDHWLMAQYLPGTTPGRKLLHEHNAEYVIWKREADAARSLLMRVLLRMEYRRVRSYEGQILGKFDRTFAVSEADRQALLDLGADPMRLDILPNIPDQRLLEAPALSFAQLEPAVLFLGTLSWKPNIDSATRLLTGIFPLVRSRLPDARLLIAGRGAPKHLVSLASRTSGVEMVPEVVDAEALYRRARVFVEATTSGGGTKLKVLNALARGLPVVASPHGAAGLEVSSGRDTLLAESDVLLAEAIVRLMTDELEWQRLSGAGRALVRERYVPEVAFRPLKDALRAHPAGSAGR